MFSKSEPYALSEVSDASLAAEKDLRPENHANISIDEQPKSEASSSGKYNLTLGNSSHKSSLADEKIISKNQSCALSELSAASSARKKDIRPENNPDISIEEQPSNEASLVYYNLSLGLFYMVLSALTYQMVSAIVKNVSSINPTQLSIVRQYGPFAGALPIAVYSRNRILVEKKDRIKILVRAFMTANGLYMSVLAYRYLPLAEAAVLISSTPVLTACIARVYLKERCSLMLLTSLVITILGVLTSVRLPELIRDRSYVQIDSSFFGGLAAAVATVLFLSLTFVLTRELKHIHFSVMLLYTGVIGTTENILINAATSPFVLPYCGWDQVQCVLLGVFAFVSSLFFVLSLQHQPAALASVQMSSLNIIVSCIFQVLLFSQYPDVYVICGACLVMASLAIIGIRIWLLTKNKDSRMRKVLRCFLS